MNKKFVILSIVVALLVVVTITVSSYVFFTISNKNGEETVMIDGAGCEWTTEKYSQCNGQPQPNGATANGHEDNGYARIIILSS